MHRPSWRDIVKVVVSPYFYRWIFISFIHAVNIYWALSIKEYSLSWGYQGNQGSWFQEPGNQATRLHLMKLASRREREIALLRKRVKEMTFQSQWSVSWTLKESEERKRAVEKVFQKRGLSHCRCLSIAMVSSHNRSLSSLVWDSRCLRSHSCLHLQSLCWCFAPCFHCTYCVHSPEFLLLNAFLIIWYWYFKYWSRVSFLTSPQVELIISSCDPTVYSPV